MRGSLRDRYLSKVVKRRGCWGWLGARTYWRGGYGVLGRGGRSQGLVLAHRASWEIHRGPIPDGMCVLHKCDNPPCTNPAHLFLGSKRDNARDMVGKGRRPDVARRGREHHYSGVPTGTRGKFPSGAAHPRARLTAADVRVIRKSYPTMSLRKLANCFGVHHATIFAIIHRKSWR